MISEEDSNRERVSESRSESWGDVKEHEIEVEQNAEVERDEFDAFDRMGEAKQGHQEQDERSEEEDRGYERENNEEEPQYYRQSENVQAEQRQDSQRQQPQKQEEEQQYVVGSSLPAQLPMDDVEEPNPHPEEVQPPALEWEPANEAQNPLQNQVVGNQPEPINQQQAPEPVPLPSNPQPQADVMPASAQVLAVFKMAHKQRLTATYSIFKEYSSMHRKTCSSHKIIIRNIQTEISQRRQARMKLQDSLTEYFANYIKVNKEFSERVTKLSKQEPLPNGNKYANIKEQLKQGFQGLLDTRQKIGQNSQELEPKIQAIIKSTNSVFELYQRAGSAVLKAQNETVEKHYDCQKQLIKHFEGLQKLLKKNKEKGDIFMSVVGLIDCQRQYRKALIAYGKTIIQVRKSFMKDEAHMFRELQTIINKFKNESRAVYSSKGKEFAQILPCQELIKKQCSFENLCTITDVDYIRAVLDLHRNKDSVGLTNNQMVEYLQLNFFDRIVGESSTLLKASVLKVFPLDHKQEELVHSISGYLVHYNRASKECKDKYQMKHLNATIVGESVVQFDEATKTFIFTSNRTSRLQLKSQDTAEELICYLNEQADQRDKQGQK